MTPIDEVLEMKPEGLAKLLRTIRGENPGASAAEVATICRQKILKDQRLSDEMFSYWFRNSYRDVAVVEGLSGSVAIEAVQRRRVTANVQSIKSEMTAALMDHALSDGTLLRFATFGQCAREGGWLSDIAKHGKGNEIVGNKLSERDLQNLHMRHFSGAGAAA